MNSLFILRAIFKRSLMPKSCEEPILAFFYITGYIFIGYETTGACRSS
ncbi:hypothetical protein TREVI0001_1044 [Treponema vincentii ATCC 35580]|uniref:Uncharacterized protein n=1 Tax=Treponema vincentii ATCC 35580 TaxID=596324 RepID=C8PSK6_9SPIR|nr:hypothetical protein TREVI0001_1044 [Treponema vincentii ATCC 35580]